MKWAMKVFFRYREEEPVKVSSLYIYLSLCVCVCMSELLACLAVGCFNQ